MHPRPSFRQACLLLAYALVPTAAAAEAPQTWVGTIDQTLDIQMTLRSEVPRVSGSYFYARHKIDIPVQGSIDQKDHIVLTESDEQGKATGLFTGQRIKGAAIDGTWSTP